MDVYLEIAGSQIDGARDYQEDAFLTTYVDDEKGLPKSTALMVMADGMGGHAAGNIASNLVVSTFNKHFTSHFGSGEVQNILREALDKANDGLRSSIKETPALDGMGCTMVTAAIARGRMWWISVGDSHLYLIRDRELHKKNEDHSYGGYLDRMKAQGMDVQAEQGLSRNMLMSAITGEEIAEIDCPNKSFQLLPGDRLIVASDGLDTLSNATVLQTSLWAPSAKECVEALLKAVEDAKRPRQDNTTVICCDIIKRDAEPVAPPKSRGEKDRELGDTQPIEMTAVNAGLDDARTQPGAAAQGGDDVSSGASGSRKGLVIGAVVALLLAVAGGAAWMMLGDKPEPPGIAQAPAPAASEPPPAATTPPAVTTPPSVSEPTTATEPAATTPPSATASSQAAEPALTTPEPPTAPKENFRDTLASGGEGPEMVRIPAGSFLMGVRGSTVANQRPEHRVDLKTFAVSAKEVTFAQFEQFTAATRRAAPDNQYLDKNEHPVFGVSWDDALAYTQWLSRETGKKYRLPTEAEWEYMATTGTDTPYWWGYQLEKNRAHCFNCTTSLNPRQPTKVGSFEPNPFGVYDTVGNVAEWVRDCYHPTYKDAPSDGSNWDGGDCSVRVVRGGSYSSPTPGAQKRDKLLSTQGYPDVGIRIVRDL